MRVLILGGDGYLGWATAMAFSRRGFEVAVLDNYFRRRASLELNREPLFPASPSKSISVMSAIILFCCR